MLSARHRFHGHGSLQAVYRNGQAVRGPLMSLKYVSRRSNKGYRVAVVVSKKVHKSAVTRNRIRRRIYEIIRQAGEELTTGKDLIITVFSERTAELGSSELTSMTEDLLKKATNKPKPGNATSVGRGIVRRDRE